MGLPWKRSFTAQAGMKRGVPVAVQQQKTEAAGNESGLSSELQRTSVSL